MKRSCPVCYALMPQKLSCRTCNGTGIHKVRYETAEVRDASILVNGVKINAFEALKTALPKKEDIVQKPKEEQIKWQFEKLQSDYRTDWKDQKENYEEWLKKEQEKQNQ